jgi:hypothetical protein
MTTIAAAIVLLAGCGGGSHKSSTVTVGGGPQTVPATGKTFSTVVPLGFTYISSKAQYYAVGAEENGHTTNLVVIHEPARLGDINTIARHFVSAYHKKFPGGRISGPTALTVGGEPALKLDFLENEGREHWHGREVFVRHGEWVYYIRDFSPVAQDATAGPALEELIGAWKWK